MAHVMIPFANGKGGVGKTALACSYAVERVRAGADVVLADISDEQHSAYDWSQVRNHNGIEPKVKVEVLSAREALEMAGRPEVLVVDTPGWTDKTTLNLARKSNFMVVPTGPNPTYELAPTVRLLHGLKAEGIESWRVGVVFSRFSADAKTREAEEEFARDYLKQAGYGALEGCIAYADVYSSGLALGYGLTEVPGDERLRSDATRLLQSISKAVLGAERRMDRLRGAEKSSERDRGGRS